MQTVVAFQPKDHFMNHPEAHKFEVTCTSCNLRELCLPGGICIEDLEQVQNIVYARRAIKRGWYPVVGGIVIRYRREIKAFEKFTLHSRIAGWDEKWFYFEHRFETNGTVAALAYSRGVMRNREGAVPARDVLALIGYNEPSPALPEIVSKFL